MFFKKFRFVAASIFFVVLTINAITAFFDILKWVLRGYGAGDSVSSIIASIIGALVCLYYIRIDFRDLMSNKS